MDARRSTAAGLAAGLAGAVVVCAGSVAWALAATSMAAVQAAEARALGPGHTAELPGEDELALAAHDARLAAVLVVACGLGLLVAALPRRVVLPAWGGGVGAVVVANAALAGAVDGGSVPLAAAGLALVTASVAVVVAVVAAGTGAVVRGRGSRPPGAGDRRPLVGTSLLGAGTLPVLHVHGELLAHYREWVPADLVTSNLVAAAGLALGVLAAAVLLARGAVDAVLGVLLPLAALLVLVEPSSLSLREGPWVPGPVLALAAAPLALLTAGERSRPLVRRPAVAVALLAAGALLAAVPLLLAVPVLLGGMLGMLVTAPAGAYINYDGLPVVGGGLVVAAGLLVAHLVLRRLAGPLPDPPPLPSEAVTPTMS